MTDPRLDDSIAKIVANKSAILRYIFIPQAIAGLFLLILGYSIGHDHLRLIRSGVRTTGKIVAFKKMIIGSPGRPSSIGAQNGARLTFLPIVEFQDKNRTLQFQDWAGTSSPIGLNATVHIIFDSDDPSIAMIDRRIWNWFPWAPTFLVGAFLCLVAFKGWLNLRTQSGSS